MNVAKHGVPTSNARRARELPRIKSRDVYKDAFASGSVRKVVMTENVQSNALRVMQGRK